MRTYDFGSKSRVMEKAAGMLQFLNAYLCDFKNTILLKSRGQTIEKSWFLSITRVYPCKSRGQTGLRSYFFSFTYSLSITPYIGLSISILLKYHFLQHPQINPHIHHNLQTGNPTNRLAKKETQRIGLQIRNPSNRLAIK